MLVGRARHQASALSAGLRGMGADVLEIPFIEIRKPRSYKALDLALKNLAEYDWLILTSVNGVDALWERLRKLHVSLPGEKVLAKVRREKFAPSSGRSFLGVRGVAAPIFDAGGACIAALSLVGPLPRFTIERTRPPLMRAAASINEFILGTKH